MDDVRAVVGRYLRADRPDLPTAMGLMRDEAGQREVADKHQRLLGEVLRLGPDVIPAVIRGCVEKLASAGDLRFSAWAQTAAMMGGAPEMLMELLTMTYYGNLLDVVTEPGPRVTEPLIRLLDDPDRRVRALAAHVLGLGGIEGERAGPRLTRMLLEEHDLLVAGAAAATVGAFDDTEASSLALAITVMEHFAAEARPELGNAIQRANTEMRARAGGRGTSLQAERDIAGGIAAVILPLIPRLIATGWQGRQEG